MRVLEDMCQGCAKVMHGVIILPVIIACLGIFHPVSTVMHEEWQPRIDRPGQKAPAVDENLSNIEVAPVRPTPSAWNEEPRISVAQIPKPTQHRPATGDAGNLKYSRSPNGDLPRYEAPTKRPVRSATARPSIDLGIKTQVEWFDDTQYYALKASTDTRFRVRHAPIPEPGSPWPMPQLYQPYNISFRINPHTFEFHSVGEPCELLEVNFRRIRRNIFGDIDVDQPVEQMGGRQAPMTGAADNGAFSVDVRSINVTVLKECTDYPYLEMDESYDLEIKRTGVSIITREVWGAIRGMETFSQLVYQDEQGDYWVNKTYIHDYPRFKHRGILLDTSRHFLEKETLLANLEAMAQNKMNVFHWHIVDDQSFPYESKVFPNLTKYGAYHPVTHLYSHEDIAEIIEQARIRGIRVVPEFDTPGHTFSWGYGQDHLLTPCYSYKREPNGMYGPINPILKKTYTFLRQLFDEVLGVFKDKYVHLGGDEVPFDCWQSNPFLQNFMKRNNITDIKELLGLYGRELLKIVTELGENRAEGSGYIVWQEVFDNGVKLKPDAIVQIWSGDSYDIDRVTKSGLRALFSTCWYLDYINYGQDWDKYYRCEQVGSQLDDYRVRNQSLLIGGEACLWTEYADDDSVMSRLWPRASAAAERLWSDRHLVDVHQAAPRIEEQRCRMIRRGLHVGVLSGPGHCTRYRQPTNKPKRAPEEKFFVPVEYIHEPRTKNVRPVAALRPHQPEPNLTRTVYMVVMNTMYIVPLVIVVLICLGAVLVMFPTSSRSRFITILSYPIGSAAQKRLMFIFFIFAVAWCVWTAPIWMHTWVSPAEQLAAESQ